MTIGYLGGVGTPGYAAPTAASGATGTLAAAGASGAAKSNMASQLATPNLFLKLLMVELEHQNPTSPMTPASMLQQTAMLSQVEAMTSMRSVLDQQQRASATAEATGLIGKEVTAVVGSKTVTGTVSAVSLSSTGTPTLAVGGTDVSLSSITQVRGAAASTASAPTIANTSTTTA